MRSAPRIVFLVCAGLAVCGAAPALAQNDHTVRSGQSLARVARRYQVGVGSLAAANGLARDAQVRPGQVLRIPERGTHYVGRGETLVSIARDHDCSVADLQRVNRLGEAPLRLGQRLVLPGFERDPRREEAERRWGRTRHPGVVTIYRSSLDQRFRIRLVDNRGRARRTAVRRLRELMRQRANRGGRMGPAPPNRLVEILARISDHFGGRTITLVSGFREAGGYTEESSRHVRGHALDVRVQGVPTQVLRDFVRGSFQNVGVGFYPRSGFVHVDVRERSTYWVDHSGPGEPPRYERAGDADASSTGPRRPRRAENEQGEGAAAAEEDDRNADPDRAALRDESGSEKN